MRWTILNCVAQREFFSKGLRAKVDAANESIARILRNRAQLEKSIEQARGVPITDADFDNMIGIQSYRLSKLTCLQDEAKFRRELAPVLALINVETAKQAEVEFQRFEKAKEDIRQKLLAMGYSDFQTGEPDRSAIEPGWILRHPLVREAMESSESLHLQGGDNAASRANNEALERLENELIELRDRSLSAA